MTDPGMPSDEQLRRIERGVMDRIDARRRAVRSVAGGVTALVLVAGGFALLPRAIGTSGTSSAAGSSGGDSSSGRASTLVVLCHRGAAEDSATRPAKADPADLPRSAILACATVDFQSAEGTVPSPSSGALTSGAAAPSSASLPTVCRDPKGSVQVYPAAVDCTEYGMVAVRAG